MCGLYLLTTLSNNQLLRNDISDVMTTCLKKVLEGLSWWPSGQDSVFPLQVHRFDPWSGNLRFGMPHSADKKKIAKRNKLLDVPTNLSFFALILRRRFHFEICLPWTFHRLLCISSQWFPTFLKSSLLFFFPKVRRSNWVQNWSIKSSVRTASKMFSFILMEADPIPCWKSKC